jgi:hypothetical protein
MADELKPGEMPETQGDTAPDGAGSGDAGELERMRAALKKANREAAENRKKLEGFEKAEDERKLASASDLEKAQMAAKKAADSAEQAIKTANERMLKAAFIAEASKHGAKSPADAYALAIADGAQVGIGEDGNATGVAEAVKALVDAGRLPLTGRPGAPGLDGGAGGQIRPGKTITLTDEQKRMALHGGMTEEQYITYLQASPGVAFTPDADKKPE